MKTEDLLKENGIIKYEGKLIYVEKGKYFYRGVPYPSLLKVQQKIDSHLARQKYFLENAKIIDIRE